MSESSGEDAAPGGDVVQEAARLGAAGQHREAVGLLAALQALDRPDQVVVIVCAIAGIGIGIAFRKGFKVPATG